MTECFFRTRFQVCLIYLRSDRPAARRFWLAARPELWVKNRNIMSKGKDFRGPRKRGFDDDGPSPYDAPRPSRSSRPSFGGGGFGGGPDMAAPSPTSPPVDAVVKWFKGDKGFGFVELSNGTGDAFLHIGALQSAGYETVPPGAKLKVYVGNGMKGAQVTRVLEVDTAGASERAPAPRFT